MEGKLAVLDRVARCHDLNSWMDVTYIPGSDEQEIESPPVLEIIEMLWEESVSRAVIAMTVKYEAQSLE
jgi:hypothetical protein